MAQAGGSQHGLHAGAALPAGLCALLADLAGSPSAAVSAEALAALQPVAAAQPDALHSCWDRVRAVLLESLSTDRVSQDVAGVVVLSLPYTSSASLGASYFTWCKNILQSSIRAPSC